jgi:NTP pyrophosphatase (non-canonical NTP hydrolase)
MDTSEMQRIAADLGRVFKDKFGNRFMGSDIKFLMMDMMEEVGELARAVNRKEIRREEPDHPIESEIVDVFVDLMWIANHYGIDIEKGFRNTLEKWKKRYEMDFQGG